jgi:hypothetical protein
VFEAAFRSDNQRLPEALSGHPRAEVPAPVPYPQANRPQAWSASAVVQLIQIMLGLYPFAPLHVLAVVRPRLPAWLPELTLRRLRVAQAEVDLHFRRNGDGSASWARGRLMTCTAASWSASSTSRWITRRAAWCVPPESRSAASDSGLA